MVDDFLFSSAESSQDIIKKKDIKPRTFFLYFDGGSTEDEITELDIAFPFTAKSLTDIFFM